MTDPTDPTASSAAQRTRLIPSWLRLGDATTLLTGFIILLMGLPSMYVFAPLGGAGAPAQLLGLVAALWWAANRVARSRDTPTVSQPVRRAFLVFVAAVLASYIAGTVRPIDPIELRSADRGLLMILSWLGIFLVCTDGIPTRERLDTLLRRLSIAGGAVATLGLLQFETGMAFTNYIQIPGLSVNSDLFSVTLRNGVLRPAGTAIHPIEFGVALTMFLPITLHYAIHDVHRRPLRRWYPVIAVALAIPVSVSRSAIVGSAVVLAFMIPTLTPALRKRAYLAMFGLLAVVYVAVPGMLGTILGLFTGIGTDTSAQSRTGSYALAFEFIKRAPVFGRGYSTFLPSYRILDNQYLGTLIELGVVGLTALLLMQAIGIRTARRLRAKSSDPQTRSLAQALAATVAAGSASFALFDAFSFPMIPGLMFLALGAISALRRLEAVGSVIVPPDQNAVPEPPVPRDTQLTAGP